MHQIKDTLKNTTCHGLPRTMTSKPLFVRLSWLFLFLGFLGLFIKGSVEFVNKLQSRQVTSALETNKVPFRYPDIYACFENSVSTSYAVGMSNETAAEFSRQLSEAAQNFRRVYSAKEDVSAVDLAEIEQWHSFSFIQSLQYSFLVDALAQRIEQSLVSSDATYVNEYGLPSYDPVQAAEFYHPVYMRCIRWVVNDTLKDTLSKSGTSSGLIITLLTDSNFSASAAAGPPIQPRIFAGGSPIPVSDWSLSRLDFDDPDRRAGVRIFLCPPGEYPTGFVTSFSLGPGRYHTVEIDMMEQVYNSASFDDCLSNPDPVQFVNPYLQEPYDHNYSYSYCYYYEYHKQYQAIMNLSGDASPLPWPLRGSRYLFNLTGPQSFLQKSKDSATGLVPDSEVLSRVSELAQSRCTRSSPCATLNYEATVSSTDWPTFSSVAPFVASTVAQALADAKSKNLTAPALEYLTRANATDAAAFINANLLKVNFKPHRVSCNRVTLSIDYRFENFISDIGGIMGIYLGMSLLTLCEVLELFVDLIMVAHKKRRRAAGAAKTDTNGLHALSTHL